MSSIVYGTKDTAAFRRTSPPTIKTPESNFGGPGVSSEGISLQMEKLFDRLLNNIIVFRCEVSQNTLDGLHSQDYHLELIGGVGKHNSGALVRLK